MDSRRFQTQSRAGFGLQGRCPHHIKLPNADRTYRRSALSVCPTLRQQTARCTPPTHAVVARFTSHRLGGSQSSSYVFACAWPRCQRCPCEHCMPHIQTFGQWGHGLALGITTPPLFAMKRHGYQTMIVCRRDQGLALPTVLALSMVSGVLLLACWRNIALAQAWSRHHAEQWQLRQVALSALLTTADAISQPNLDALTNEQPQWRIPTTSIA